VTAYGDADGPLIHVDSYGLIAIAVPNGRADEALSLAEGLSVGFRSGSVPLDVVSST
jgi:S-adenosylmethionine hydrolase